MDASVYVYMFTSTSHLHGIWKSFVSPSEEGHEEIEQNPQSGFQLENIKAKKEDFSDHNKWK